MRKIRKIIVHHAATKLTPLRLTDVRPDPSKMVSILDIRRWHQKRGFIEEGYHYFIRQDGVIEVGRPLFKVGAHTRGHNEDSVGICLAGGLSEDDQPANNYTPDQIKSLSKLIDDLWLLFPDMEGVYGHKDFDPVNKPFCPMIDVREL